MTLLQVFTPTIDTSALEQNIPDQDVNQQEHYLIYGVTFLLFVKSNVNRVLLNMYFFPDIYPRFWIGLNDIEEEGQFVWVNTRSLNSLHNFTSWSKYEPNNIYVNLSFNFTFIRTADCCVTTNDGFWSDDSCENLNPFICEITL